MNQTSGSWFPAFVGGWRVLRAWLPPARRSAPIWTDADGTLSRAEFFRLARGRRPGPVISSASQREVALDVVAALLRGRVAHVLSPHAGALARRQLDAHLSGARMSGAGVLGARPLGGGRHGIGAVFASSSGTSGTPHGDPTRRGVLVAAQLLSAIGMLPRLRHPVVAGLAPVYHGHGLSIFLMTVVLGGHYRVIGGPDGSPGLGDTPVDLLSGVPIQLTEFLADHPESGARVGAVLAGSDRLDADLARRLTDRLGPVWNAYGATETGTVCLASPADRRAGPDCVGPPLSGVRIRAVDGLLVVTSPMARRPFAGDAGRVDADGLVHVLGRADGLVVSGGVTLGRSQLAAFLHGLPGVHEVRLHEIPDARFGRRVRASLDVGSGCSLDADQVRELVRRELGAAHVPAEVVLNGRNAADQAPR